MPGGNEIHWYAVYMTSYVDEATKAGIEGNEEEFMVHGRTITEIFYNATKKLLAERAFARAAIAAMQNPLVFEVVMLLDGEVLVRLQPRRD